MKNAWLVQNLCRLDLDTTWCTVSRHRDLDTAAKAAHKLLDKLKRQKAAGKLADGTCVTVRVMLLALVLE